MASNVVVDSGRNVQMALARTRATSLSVLLLCALSVHALRAQELPTPDGKVNDFAKLLDESQRRRLEDQLGALERDTSAEVALVTMGTIGNQSIEDYATTLFNAWGIGKKRRDNGLLVLVVVQDRAMRIEVGYGLEGVLPDGLSGAVIRETFLPRFRTDDYAAGVLDGMTRLIEIVRRHETLTAEQRAALDRDAVEAGKSWELVWLFAAFAGAGAFALGTAAGAKVVVQLLFGLCFTGGALYFSTFIVPQTAVWGLGLLAAGVAALGFMLARRPKWRRIIRGPGAGGGASGWVADGRSDSSSSSSGGSGSGSSDSFGGGSSGGGGATGHW